MKKSKKGGFTLTEMLVSVLLLGFVSLMATVMTSAVLSASVSMKEAAQAEILGSEALDNVQNRLRFVRNVKVSEDGSTVEFDMDDANKNYILYLIDGRILLGQKQADGSMKGDSLFEGVSYGNLTVDSLHFKMQGADRIEISVSIAYGEKTLWNGSATVKPLNGIAAA